MGRTIRKSVFFVLSVGLTSWAGYQLAWHHDLRDKLHDHPWQSVGLLVLSFFAIVVFLHSTARPHNGSALLGLVLGIAAVVWGKHLFKGIHWTTLGLFGLTLVVLAVLWAFTVLDGVPKLGLTRVRRVVARST